MKEITSNSLIILVFQSKGFEIIRPVVVGFSRKWERRKGLEFINNISQSLNSTPQIGIM